MSPMYPWVRSQYLAGNLNDFGLSAAVAAGLVTQAESDQIKADAASTSD